MLDTARSKIKQEFGIDKIIDGQVYIASAEFLPPGFIQSVLDNLCLWMDAQNIGYDRKKIQAMCLSYFNDPHCDELVRQMDAAGIDQSVLMLPDFSYRFRDLELDFEEMIRKVRQILNRHPNRFFFWLGVDPRWGEKGFDLFKREVEAGQVQGMKLYPPCGYSPSDETLYPYYEICREKGLPVSVHMGGTASVFRLDGVYPRLVDKAAYDFPNVNFVLSHASTCYTDECLMLCTARPNIYLEVSGFASQPIDKLSELFRHGVGHKVIFGTDWPSFRAQGPQSQFIEKLISEDGPISYMRPFEARRFFGETIKSLMPQS